MSTSTLVEMIFRGTLPDIKTDFFSKIMIRETDIRFVFPEDNLSNTISEITNVFLLNDYIDLVITTDTFIIKEITVKSTFINIGRDGDSVEFLAFFDINDMRVGTTIDNFNYLKNWANEFNTQYNFSYYICQMGAAGDGEYFFDSNGLGPLLTSYPNMENT